MIFNTKATQKNAGQKLTDISLEKGKLNELWSELDETSQATVSGGVALLENVMFTNGKRLFVGGLT